MIHLTHSHKEYHLLLTKRLHLYKLSLSVLKLLLHLVAQALQLFQLLGVAVHHLVGWSSKIIKR